MGLPIICRLYNSLTLGLYDKSKRLKESEDELKEATNDAHEFYREVLESLKNEELKERGINTGWTEDTGLP